MNRLVFVIDTDIAFLRQEDNRKHYRIGLAYLAYCGSKVCPVSYLPLYMPTSSRFPGF